MRKLDNVFIKFADDLHYVNGDEQKELLIMRAIIHYGCRGSSISTAEMDDETIRRIAVSFYIT